MRRFFLLHPRFPATLPLGATRFSPTVMTQGWLVVVQVSRPRTRVAGGKGKKRGGGKKKTRTRGTRKTTSSSRRSVIGGQISRARTKTKGGATSKQKTT